MKAASQVISLGCRLFLAWLFVFASYDKVWDPAGFADSVARYELLPLALINASSALLAWLEIICGALLLLGLALRPAAAWTMLLLCLFTGLMVWAGITGAGYDCGCFPGQPEGHAAGFGAALRDLLFLLPALWLMWRPGSWLALDSLGRRP